MKFKTGDRVRLLDFRHEDFENHGGNNFYWVSNMNKYIGKEFTVSRVMSEKKSYSLKESENPGWGYMEHWLELSKPILEIEDELFQI